MNTLIPNGTSIDILMSYNRFCIQSKIKYRVMRKEYPVFNLICYFFEYICSLFVALFTFFAYNKFEPLTPAWISICQYVHDCNGVRASTYDIYSNFSKTELENWSNNPQDILNVNGKYYDIFFSKYTSVAETFKYWIDYKLENTILIGQLCPSSTIIRFAKNANFDNSKTFKSSSVRFLEIEYQCDNKPPIGIEVPRSHYFVGNEILSKTYVLRYLEHLPNYSNWGFYDFDYSLRIVDDKSELFSMNGNQYILLEEDGYKIIDIEEPKDYYEPFDMTKQEDQDEDDEEDDEEDQDQDQDEEDEDYDKMNNSTEIQEN